MTKGMCPRTSCRRKESENGSFKSRGWEIFGQRQVIAMVRGGSVRGGGGRGDRKEEGGMGEGWAEGRSRYRKSQKWGFETPRICWSNIVLGGTIPHHRVGTLNKQREFGEGEFVKRDEARGGESGDALRYKRRRQFCVEWCKPLWRSGTRDVCDPWCWTWPMKGIAGISGWRNA